MWSYQVIYYCCYKVVNNYLYFSGTTYSIEELVAQLFVHAKEMAVAHTKQKIKDTVITVPPYFNQAERRSLLLAAELAGLKVSLKFFFVLEEVKN